MARFAIYVVWIILKWLSELRSEPRIFWFSFIFLITLGTYVPLSHSSSPCYLNLLKVAKWPISPLEPISGLLHIYTSLRTAGPSMLTRRSGHACGLIRKSGSDDRKLAIVVGGSGEDGAAIFRSSEILDSTEGGLSLVPCVSHRKWDMTSSLIWKCNLIRNKNSTYGCT
jgi:hypothetical protein